MQEEIPPMVITLEDRTADTVKIYFEKANTQEIKRVLPQKAKTVEEALTDYERTLLPNASSFGQTICVDGQMEFCQSIFNASAY